MRVGGRAAWAAGCCVLGVIQCVCAGAGVSNGTFDAGLDDWSSRDVYGMGTVVTAAPSAHVTATAGYAALSTYDADVGRVSVLQPLMFPSNALTLSVDMAFHRLEGQADELSGGFPDHMQASFLAYDGAAYDRRFIAFNASGPYSPDALTATNATSLGGGWYRFVADITNLAGRAGTLYFDLDDEPDGAEAVAWVDNVVVTEASPPPPLSTNGLDRPFTVDWVLNRQTGTYFGSIRMHNTQPADGFAMTAPCRCLLSTNENMRLMAPTGVLPPPDGRQYLELTAAFNAATGNGRLEPGETVLIPGVEVYRRYRTEPPDAAFALEVRLGEDNPEPE